MKKLLTFILVMGVAMAISAQCVTSVTCNSNTLENDYGAVGGVPNFGSIDSIEYTIAGNVVFSLVDSVVGSVVYSQLGNINCTDTATKTRYFYGGHPVGYTCNVNQLLPVEFINVGATLKDKFIQVSFMTASEINNSHFVIEKFDGENYVEIVSIEGSGTSVGIKAYFVMDLDVNSGNNIYRIKQVDFNGNFEYSQAFRVKVYKPDQPDQSEYLVGSDMSIGGYDLLGRKR